MRRKVYSMEVEEELGSDIKECDWCGEETRPQVEDNKLICPRCRRPLS